MLLKESGRKAKLLDATKTISKEKMWSERSECSASHSLSGVTIVKTSPLVGFLFCNQSKQFNWLNTLCVQFYWNRGDLGAFSSTWLADGNIFARLVIYLDAKFFLFSTRQNFAFYIFGEIPFFFNSTYMRVFNFRQIFEEKSYIRLIFRNKPYIGEK